MTWTLNRRASFSLIHPYLQRSVVRLKRPMSTLCYQDAVKRLNSLQSNAATLQAVRASGGRLSDFAIPEMLEYLERIGYNVSSQSIETEYLCLFLKPRDLNALNVIHITGTKGKGSTSAFTESILRHTHPEWKIGYICF